MAYEASSDSVSLDADWISAESSQDALDRGAARRRQGRTGSRPTPYDLIETRPVSRAPLHAVPEPQSPPSPVRDSMHDSRWRARVESEIASMRAALADLQASLADDREAIRAAEEQASLDAAERLLDRLGGLEGRLDRVEGQLSAAQPSGSGTPEEARSEPAWLPEYAQRLETLEQRIVELADEQATLSDAFAVVSQSLVAGRMKTTTLYMGGFALALISAAVWLFTKAPSIF